MLVHISNARLEKLTTVVAYLNKINQRLHFADKIIIIRLARLQQKSIYIVYSNLIGIRNLL